MDLTTVATRALHKYLLEEKLEAELANGVVHLKTHDLESCCKDVRVLQCSDGSRIALASFDLSTEQLSLRHIQVMGLGRSDKEASDKAAFCWYQLVIAVVLNWSAQGVSEQSSQSTRMFLPSQEDVEAWDVLIGPQLLYALEHGDTMKELVQLNDPVGFCLNMAKDTLKSKRLHWMFLYYLRQDTETSAAVIVDNEAHEVASSKLQAINWSEDQVSTYGFAQFVIFQPSESEVTDTERQEIEIMRRQYLVEDILECDNWDVVEKEDIERHFKQVSEMIDENEDDPDLFKARAALLENSGETGRALADLNRALELKPDDADGLYRRAVLKVNRGEQEEAIEDFKTSMRVNEESSGDDLRAAWGLTLLYMNTLEYEKALPVLDLIIEAGPDVYFSFYCRAICKHGTGDFEEAAKDLTRALALNPDSKECFYERGHIYSHLGDHERALSDYTRLALIEPDNPDYIEGKAYEYNQLGDLDLALGELNRLEELQPGKPGLYEIRSQILFKQGRYEEVISETDRALELVAEYPSIFDIRAEAFEKLDKQELAEDTRRQAEKQWMSAQLPSACKTGNFLKELNPDSTPELNSLEVVDPARILGLRATLYEDLELFDKAAATYSKAVDRDPNNCLWLQARIGAYQALGEWEKAIDDATRTIELEPGNARHHSNRAALRAQAGQLEEALDDYRAARRYDNDYAVAYGGIGFVLSELGEYKQALQEYNAALDMNDTVIDWYLGRAFCYHALAQFDRALGDYDLVATMSDTEPEAYYQRGQIFLDLRDYQSALEDFDRTLDLMEDTAELYVSRAWAHFKLGNLRLSSSDAKRAIELDPEGPYGVAAADTLARIHLSEEQLDEALAIAEKYLAIDGSYADLFDVSAQCYEILGDSKKAIDARKRATELGYDPDRICLHF